MAKGFVRINMGTEIICGTCGFYKDAFCTRLGMPVYHSSPACITHTDLTEKKTADLARNNYY